MAGCDGSSAGVLMTMQAVARRAALLALAVRASTLLAQVVPKAVTDRDPEHRVRVVNETFCDTRSRSPRPEIH
jgi:hypothetical protein